MAAAHFGVEQVTEADRAYRGSRFSEVRDALFVNPYQPVWGGADQPPLPVYDVTLLDVLRGILPFGAPYLFRQAVARAVDSRADLRWGPDRKGFRRIIHPNGVCLTGLWEISADSPYTGYFCKSSRALVIARYSTCCKETRRGRADSTRAAGNEHALAFQSDHRMLIRELQFVFDELADQVFDAQVQLLRTVRAIGRDDDGEIGQGAQLATVARAERQHLQ